MRINGLNTYGEDGEPLPGDYFLIRVVPQDREDHYELARQPGRTNMSHEEMLTGWLGETNNVSRYAEGAVRITNDPDGRLRVTRIDADALYAETNPDTTL